MSNITAIVPQLAIDLKQRVVRIDLICSDKYAARVLYEDILARAGSDEGLTLQVKARRVPEPGAVL